MAQAYCKPPLTGKVVDVELVNGFADAILAAGFGDVEELWEHNKREHEELMKAARECYGSNDVHHPLEILYWQKEQLAEKEKRIAELRKYVTHHLPTCPEPWNKCLCGLDALLGKDGGG